MCPTTATTIAIDPNYWWMMGLGLLIVGGALMWFVNDVYSTPDPAPKEKNIPDKQYRERLMNVGEHE